MTAQLQDLLAQLQSQQSAPQDNSFLGLQAPPDPNQISSLLARLRSQQAVDNTPDEPGRKAFASIGQYLGNAVTGAAAQQAPAPNPVADAIGAAKSAYAKMVANGVPENTARKAVSSMLVQAGVPGAENVLASANDQGTKTAVQNAEVAKNTAQAAASTDEVRHRLAEEKGGTWHFVSQTGNVQLYKNANGKPEVVTVADKMGQASDPLTQSQIEAAVDFIKKGQGTLAEVIGRLPAQDKLAIIAKLRDDPKYRSGDTVAANTAYRVFTSGTKGDAARFNINVAAHGQALLNAKKALDSGDLQLANRIAQEAGAQTGDANITGYNALNGIYAKERVKAIVNSGGGTKEREEAERQSRAALSYPQLLSVVQGTNGLIKTQHDNLRNQFTTVTKRTNFDALYPWPVNEATGGPADNVAAANTGPREGQTATGPNGQTAVFTAGKWIVK